MLLGERTFDDTAVMQQQMSMGAPNMDTTGAMKQEREHLEMVRRKKTLVFCRDTFQAKCSD